MTQGLAFLRYGPFWRPRDRAADIEVYRSTVSALVDEYCARRGHCLTIVPRPNPEFYRQECEVLAEHGFAVRRETTDPNRYLVDVSLDEDAQMRSLDQRWRYNLRQALDPQSRNPVLRQRSRRAMRSASLYAAMVERKNFAAPSARDAGDAAGTLGRGW